MSASEKYQKLCEMSRRVRLLNTVSYLLDWDSETYLPKDSLALRSEQVELMAEIKHTEETNPEFGKLLDSIESELNDLDEIEQANVRRWKSDFTKAGKLSSEFVAKFAKATSDASRAWDEAKTNDQFSHFAPHLKKIVDLCREKSELIGYEDHPYNALLADYEEEMDVKTLDELFGKLQPILTEKAKKHADLSPDPQFMHGDFDSDKVLELSKFLLETQCLDMNSARIDVSAHPFCSGAHPKNIRLTSHRETSSIMANVSAVMHEGGHALYEQGIEEKYFGTPVGETFSLGLHESQSRFWECFIGQSKPFCTFLLPHLQKFFPEKFDGVTDDELYAAINKIRPSFIRIYADEVTYILHVILRYEIEKALLEGNLEVDDLPTAWNEKMEKYLGIVPENNRVGCLQDVHWSFGLFGYFPTYALGTLYAAQWHHQIQQTFPDLETKIASGNFLEIRNWHRENIQRHGRHFSPTELSVNITGHPLTPDAFLEYLNTKY